jgi:hypothetical protein
MSTTNDTSTMPAGSVERPVKPIAWMPVLGHPLAIPVALLDARQAMQNHGQTLERLAERGGLSLSEAAAVAWRRRWHNMTDSEALAALKEAGQRHGVRVA